MLYVGYKIQTMRRGVWSFENSSMSVRLAVKIETDGRIG